MPQIFVIGAIAAVLCVGAAKVVRGVKAGAIKATHAVVHVVQHQVK